MVSLVNRLPKACSKFSRSNLGLGWVCALSSCLWACGPSIVQHPLPAPYNLAPDASQDWDTPPPASTELPKLPVQPVQSFQLESGLRVSVVEKPGSATTAIGLWVPEAGSHSHGPVAAMVNALRAGTKLGDTVLVNPRLSGRSIDTWTNPSGTHLRWEVLSRATRSALKIFAAFSTQPAFVEEETMGRLRQSLNQLQQYSSTSDYLFDIVRDEMPGFVYPENDDVARAILALSPAKLGQIHACRMLPKGSELVIAGGASFENVRTWAGEYFGGWTAQPEEHCAEWAEPEAPQEDALDKPFLQLVHSAAPEPRIAVMLPAPPVSHADYLPFRLVAGAMAVSTDSFASALRHGGSTYGIHARINSDFKARALLEVSGGMAPSGLPRNLRELVLSLRDFSKTLNEEDIDTAKRIVVSTSISTSMSNQGIVDYVLHQTRRVGEPPADVSDEAKALLAVSPERVREAARTWTDGVNPVMLAVRDPHIQVSGKLQLGERVTMIRFREAR